MAFLRYQIDSAQQRWNLYQTLFDERQDLWVVTHLRAKESLKKLVLKQQNYFSDHAHRRMQEWLRDMFETIYGDELQIVDNEFVRLWLEHVSADHSAEMSFEDSEIKKKLGSFISHWGSHTLINWMIFLGPLALEARGDNGNSLTEFLSSRPESEMRWGELYRLSLSLSRWIYTQKKWVIQSWLPHLLSECLPQTHLHIPFRRVFFDLGASLRHSEAELIKELSYLDCQIIVVEPVLRLPEPWGDAGYKRAYNVFDSLGATPIWFGANTDAPSARPARLSSDEISQSIHTEACVTQSSGLLRAAELSQRILTQNASARIFWLFPDVESVLPYLIHLRENEGLPLNLKYYHRAAEWVNFQKFIRRLRFFEGALNWMDLESQCADKQAKFNYFYLQHESELKPAHLNILKQESQAKRHLQFSWDELVTWLIAQIDDDSLMPFVQKLIFSWAERVDLKERWFLSSWLHLLEHISYQSVYESISLNNKKGSEGGLIEVLNYQEWQYELSDFIFCFGVHLEELRPSRVKINIPIQDINAIHHQLGYFLDHPAYSETEFQFYFALQNPTEKKILIRNQFLLDQRAMTPHPLYLIFQEINTNRDREENEWFGLSSPSLKQASKQSSKGFCVNASQEEFLLGKKTSPTTSKVQVSFSPSENLSHTFIRWPLQLSASQLETFLYCGFRYWAERSLRLQPFLVRPFEIEAATEGTIFHKLFEKISAQLIQEKKTHSSTSAMSLGEIVSSILENYNDQLPKHQRDILQRSLLDLGLKFLTQHQQWFADYPLVDFALLEEPVELYLDLEKKCVSLRPPEHHFYVHVRGQIDRVDVVGLPQVSLDTCGFIIVDYKRSTSTKHSILQWSQQAYYQLFLYALALEQSSRLADIYGNKSFLWMGAHFYNYHKLQYEKGFLLEELSGFYQQRPRPARPAWSYFSEKWQDYRKDLQEKLFAQLQQALQWPAYQRLRWEQRKQDCAKCSWSWACRQEQISLYPIS